MRQRNCILTCCRSTKAFVELESTEEIANNSHLLLEEALSTLDDITIEKEIGRGASSKVYRGTWAGTPIAL